LLVTLVGFAGQIEWDLPVILNWISRSFSVGLSRIIPERIVNISKEAQQEVARRTYRGMFWLSF
jgi:hypothetical protein